MGSTIMNNHFEYDIFLSFSSSDESEAKPVWQELSAHGLRIFWSDETLKNNVGKSFFNVIQHALENSKHFVLLWTTRAMKSKWVELEYETFFSQCHLSNPESRRFIIFEGNDFYQATLPICLKNIQSTKSLNEIIHITGGVNIQVLLHENKNLKDQVNKYEINLKALLNENIKLQNQLSDMKNKRNVLLFEELKQISKNISKNNYKGKYQNFPINTCNPVFILLLVDQSRINNKQENKMYSLLNRLIYKLVISCQSGEYITRITHLAS